MRKLIAILTAAIFTAAVGGQTVSSPPWVSNANAYRFIFPGVDASIPLNMPVGVPPGTTNLNAIVTALAGTSYTTVEILLTKTSARTIHGAVLCGSTLPIASGQTIFLTCNFAPTQTWLWVCVVGGTGSGIAYGALYANTSLYINN